MKLLYGLALSILGLATQALPHNQKSANSFFRFASPFNSCGSDSTGKGACLVLDEQVFKTLLQVPVGTPIEFSQFELGNKGEQAVLRLKRFSASVDGEDLEKVVLLRGGIMKANDLNTHSEQDTFEFTEGSSAFIALSPYGSNGYMEMRNGTFILSTPWVSDDGSTPDIDDYALSLKKLAKKRLSFPYQVESLESFNRGLVSVVFDTSHLDHPVEDPLDIDYIVPDVELQYTQQTIKNGARRASYRVATDIDYQMFLKKGSNRDATSSYYYTLVGSSGTIYSRDFGSDFVSSYVRIYETQDPYPSSASQALQYMQTTWNPSTPSRSFAALLSAKNLGGGVAYLNTLCVTNWAYAVNGNMVGYFPTPVRNYNQNNWDIYVFLHEVGHIWGAQHTHQLTPPADNCGNTPGCGPTQGTIMSYCHLCSNGMANINLSFHQRSKDQVKAAIANRVC